MEKFIFFKQTKQKREASNIVNSLQKRFKCYRYLNFRKKCKSRFKCIVWISIKVEDILLLVSLRDLKAVLAHNHVYKEATFN